MEAEAVGARVPLDVVDRGGPRGRERRVLAEREREDVIRVVARQEHARRGRVPGLQTLRAHYEEQFLASCCCGSALSA